jgi:hypothetical protein
MLLDEHETAFVIETKDILGEYYESDMVGDRLMECTNNEIKKEKYTEQYEKYEKCLKKKILKLITPEEFGIDAGGYLPHSREHIILQDIDKELIARSVNKGYRHLAKKLNQNNKNTNRNQLFLAVCLILAKSNLDYKFK